MSRRQIFLAAALLAPVLVIAAWIGSYTLKSATGQTVELKIRGVDPRDLLSGHYLRYQVDYGSPITCDSQREWCLCLRVGADGIATVGEQGPCSEVAACELVLRGRCDGGRFESGLERFYFGEEYQQELATVPPESTIRVALPPSGQGIVKELLVAGEPVGEWLARPPEE